ncbi:MAG: TIGR04255 family protein [Candidatus Binatia bacterium]
MNRSADATRRPYKKPPIIEAVIAMHFAERVDQYSIDKFARGRKALFSFREDVIEVQASFDLQSQKQSSGLKKIGYKLSNSDHTRVIMITPNQMSVSHLAPYPGWDAFFKEARAHWKELVKVVKHQSLARVSTRYINRIDIPVGVNGRVELHKYLTAGLSLPQYGQSLALQNFGVNCVLLDPGNQYTHVLQLATVPSPLIDHLSVTIDIDVVTAAPLPTNDDDLWALINSLQTYKNNLFEACITQETRDLFK